MKNKLFTGSIGKRPRVLIALAATGILLCVVLAQTTRKLEENTIRKLFAEQEESIEVLSSGREAGILFGDSSSAYHLRFSRGEPVMPKEARSSDYDDLSFAIKGVQALLPNATNSIRGASVYRMKRGGQKIYIIHEHGVNEAYVFAISH